MVPMSVKVVLVGRVAKMKEVMPEKGEHFYALLVAVDRAKPVMRPDGEAMEADFYKVTTNVNCGALVPGDYVKVEGRMVVKYWIGKDEVQPTKNYRQDYEIRAETVDAVQDDSKKAMPAKAPVPVLGQIKSSSLA
jgi:single-stranded DNA-binding protein